MKMRIYYEDTDLGGVVYYANYLKFCERARSELFFKRNLSPHSQDEFFVVKSVEANYIKPAKFGDMIYINTKLIKKRKASLLIFHEIFRNDELLFTTNIKVAYLKDFKPHKIPQNIIDIFI